MFGHRFDPVPHVHLLANVFHVGPHRFDANAQLFADLLVEVTGGERGPANLARAWRRQVQVEQWCGSWAWWFSID